MRVAIYARVSTADKGQNPEVQLEELRRYCAARGWQVANEIADEGHSGATDNRPGLRQLLALARSRQIDAVVVVKLDRLFRSLRHLVVTLDELQALGVTFCATRDQVDQTTPAGKLMFGLLACLGEFERSLLIERTKMGIEYARQKGKLLGRPRLGKENEILLLRGKGLSYRAIQLRLGVSRGTIGRALSRR